MVIETLLHPENHDKRYEALFLDIDQGRTKIPLFQREFVWDKAQSAKLIDSVLKGYPIGTFIFWKTREELRSYREIGNHSLPQIPKGDYAEYVLDGQQRITSLYAIRKGLRLTKEGQQIDYRDIYIDLDHDPLTDDDIVVAFKSEGRAYVSVFDVLTKKMGHFYETFGRENAEIIEEYKSRLVNYSFSSITIRDYPIEIAAEVFYRINTGGKTLTVFEIMVAKTYDEKAGFDLVERFEALRDGSSDESECLRTAKFETLPESVVIQCVGALCNKSVRSRDILKLRREQFREAWEPMRQSLFMAVDFVRHELRIPVSQLLPYPALMVPLTFFFHKIRNKKATKRQRLLIEQWMYCTAYNYRYSSGAESKIIEDLDRMARIASDQEETSYPGQEMRVDPMYLTTWNFSASDACCKLILCLFAYNEPKSFDSNGLVNLDNSNLKIATSRNFHHFFPKAHLKKHQKDASANLIANITLVDGYSNKHKIRDKAPSAYISKFEKENDEINETMKSHLITDVEKFGIYDDNYDVFIKMRCREIARQINRKLNPFGQKEGAPDNALEAAG